MPFTFNSNKVKHITYDGNKVKHLTYNGTKVWDEFTLADCTLMYSKCTGNGNNTYSYTCPKEGQYGVFSLEQQYDYNTWQPSSVWSSSASKVCGNVMNTTYGLCEVAIYDCKEGSTISYSAPYGVDYRTGNWIAIVYLGTEWGSAKVGTCKGSIKESTTVSSSISGHYAIMFAASENGMGVTGSSVSGSFSGTESKWLWYTDSMDTGSAGGIRLFVVDKDGSGSISATPPYDYNWSSAVVNCMYIP